MRHPGDLNNAPEPRGRRRNHRVGIRDQRDDVYPARHYWLADVLELGEGLSEKRADKPVAAVPRAVVGAAPRGTEAHHRAHALANTFILQGAKRDQAPLEWPTMSTRVTVSGSSRMVRATSSAELSIAAVPRSP